MTNKEIARAFNLLAKLMELQGENPYKIRSYQNAYTLLSKLGTPLSEMSSEEIKSLKGVGAAISGKIDELQTVGSMKTLERYREKVPEGIQELLMIRGVGPKKVKAVWEELGVENPVELLYACNENRLVELNGFGQKTQEEIRKQLEFYLANRGHFLYANIEDVAQHLLRDLKKRFAPIRWEWTGPLRRLEPVLECLDILVEYQEEWPDLEEVATLSNVTKAQNTCTALLNDHIKVNFTMADDGDFEKCWLETTGPLHLLQKAPVQENETELGYFDRLGSVYIPPECRTGQIKDLGAFPSNVIRHQDIRGAIHAHSTYSDGLHSVKEMAEESERLGYSYLGITDHSKIAVYADGMDEEKSQQQWAEIDHLNREKREFTILKGIECDILSDGSLDFDDHFRSGFQFVIASVHTNIKMDIDKATSRLITAIEHPQTNILGHPTGRLLLGRDGYPLHIDKVIDACAVNQVAIEINANPYRLDLDWKYIQLAVDKGVQLCINPDAHTKESITNIHFGVIIARKGWLPAESCLNTRNVDDFLAFCEK